MTQSSRSKFIAILIFVQFCLLSCVTADRQFGNEMLPPDQVMNTYVDSFSIKPRTYIYKIDSIETSNTSLYNKALGSYIDPLIGRTDVQIFSNYKPVGFEYGSTTFFGDKPVIDSMFLVLSVTGFKGDTLKGLDLDVYEVNSGTYSYGKKFYSNYNMKPHLNDTPLIKLKIKSPNVFIKRLPMKFAQKFLINEHNEQNPYYTDTVFKNIFKGLYFKTNSVESGEGCMYNVDLSSSSMMLFYHTVVNNKLDSTSITMVMYSNNVAPFNTQFITSQNDYKYVDPSQGGVLVSEIGDSTIQTKRGYISAPSGLGTVIEFPKEQIENMHKEALNRGYKNIGIHNAMLTLYVENPVWQNYDKMYSQLAAYFSFATFRYIPDYNINNSTITPSIGGLLNRSLGIYKLNITSYMQGLMSGKIKKNKLDIAPFMPQYLSPLRSVIKGSASDQPPQLTLTYTLLK